MTIREISKQDGSERIITFDEAIVRLQQYYGCDVGEALESIGIMQTSFYYFEIKEDKAI